MKKRLFAYAKTKTQISCADDQHLCFRYMDSTIPLLSKSEMSSLLPSSVAVLSRTWSETPKTGFLTTRLNYYHIYIYDSVKSLPFLILFASQFSLEITIFDNNKNTSSMKIIVGDEPN